MCERHREKQIELLDQNRHFAKEAALKATAERISTGEGKPNMVYR